MPDVVSQVIDTFVENRMEGERFIETYGRIGMAPFKERVYASRHRLTREPPVQLRKLQMALIIKNRADSQ